MLTGKGNYLPVSVEYHLQQHCCGNHKYRVLVNVGFNIFLCHAIVTVMQNIMVLFPDKIMNVCMSM